MKVSGIHKLGIAGCVAVLACVALVGCSRGQKSAKANTPPPAVPVGVATVKQRDFPVYLTGLGSVLAFNTVSLKTRIDGQITEVNFQEGQDVKIGQLLIQIDPKPYDVALATAQANLQRDESQLKYAQVQFERQKALYNDGVIAKQDLDTQEASLGQYQGTIAADKAAIDSAKLNLFYTRITSPINGRIGLRMVDIGNYVQAASTTPMVIITQLHPIAIDFTLPEDQLQAVRQRMKEGTLTVDVYSRDDQTKLSAGKLLTIDNQIDQTTGTAKFKAVFENPDNNLWPNQFVNVHLLLETKKDAITMPVAAVQRGPQGTYTYVVDSNNTVQLRPIQLAMTQGNTAVIASGLQPGERVVTDGQEKLQAGSHVTPQAPASQGAQSSKNAEGIGSQS
ncbi:MAG: efflux RND transporter periplasmic adaptor subunit [Candidatus Korobacteraceae bacterium]